MDSETPLFLRACLRQPVERTPVWMMRQAGRYLPEYRAIRETRTFLEMYKTPEVAAEVTLQPIDIVKSDAAILFSDILVVPEAMGMHLEFKEGAGPVFSDPIRDEAGIDSLDEVEAESDLDFVMDAIRLIRKDLEGRGVPLIGFCGAPWTIATYMIEGKGSKDYRNTKRWRYARPDLLHKILDRITDATISYCNAQLDAGAQALQLFDSWAGALERPGFEEFALRRVKRIIEAVKRPGVPVIYFAKGAMGWLDLIKDCGADVIGLDWTIQPQEARAALGDSVAVQGNMDPTALYAPPEKLREIVREMVTGFGREGYVANLGHGILPDVPVEHAQEFVRAVKEESA